MSSRDDAIDVLKGFGIFFVVLNHCFARGSRKFLGTEVTDDTTLYAVNRAIHFAVPLFLFLSCALLTRSYLRSGRLGSYAQSRWRKTVVPYLAASLAYSVWLGGWPWTAPDGWRELGADLLFGKASFHLYFTLVVIQVSVALPLILGALRGRSLDVRLAFLAGLAGQFVVFHANRLWFQWERPGSILLWYMVPLALGVAVGSGVERGQIRRDGPVLLFGLIAGGGAYVLASIAPLWDIATSSDLINGTYALYTGCLALLAWTWVPDLRRGKTRAFLAGLGRLSLPLFLVHPAVMHFLGGPSATRAMRSVPNGVALAAYWGVTLALSYGIARILVRFAPMRKLLGE